MLSCFISIHAAREGGDIRRESAGCVMQISIHAAREGGDRRYRPKEGISPYFNPRRP